MNINLYAPKSYQSKQFSTKPQQNVNSSRVFHQYRQEKGTESSRVKAYNLNDSQRRIKRQYSSLFKQSAQQTVLFEKGVKKIEPHSRQNDSQSKQNSIKRSYHNKQTYNIVNPTPITQTKFNQGGVRKIYLYDQTRQSNPYRSNSQSRKKLLEPSQPQSADQNSQTSTYLIKKLPTHKNASNQWHNQTTVVHFKKRDNYVNKENLDKNGELIPSGPTAKNLEKIKKNYKQGNCNAKNKSQIVAKEAGIVLENEKNGKQKGNGNKETIDFKQDYFRKYSRMGPNSQSGCLTYRHR